LRENFDDGGVGVLMLIVLCFAFEETERTVGEQIFDFANFVQEE